MAATQLSVTALPGKPHSFTAKTAATVSHTGTFTALSVTATPGKIHSFIAKTAESGAGSHTGDFTRLSVLAIPGPIHSFIAKEQAIVPAPKITVSTSAGGGQSDVEYFRRKLLRERREKHYDIAKDDQEVMEIIIEMIMSGILH